MVSAQGGSSGVMAISAAHAPQWGQAVGTCSCCCGMLLSLDKHLHPKVPLKQFPPAKRKWPLQSHLCDNTRWGKMWLSLLPGAGPNSSRGSQIGMLGLMLFKVASDCLWCSTGHSLASANGPSRSLRAVAVSLPHRCPCPLEQNPLMLSAQC